MADTRQEAPVSVLEELKDELAAYETNRERLLAEAQRKYALIHKSEIVGTYDTETDAINEGYRRIGNKPFLVKFVVPFEEPANFLSPNVVC